MRVIDPGHEYELDVLDDNGTRLLTFVKRSGLGYPGNVGHYPGTNLQEVLRAMIDRVQYLNKQIPDAANTVVIENLRNAFRKLELRAAKRHGRQFPFNTISSWDTPELLIYCPKCGHVGCVGECH